ncbi:MAG: hypothetical protein GW903_02515 [Alphaproteobacteria bacterium]|nr:hypothetical protein [Alphaproteobacteria bacterium]NCQ87846.1 hypothetical protein [Alphaproteobacteria bacterium]NCT05646.1 hypothetical protein [Alphaproteobacteria bacterium]
MSAHDQKPFNRLSRNYGRTAKWDGLIENGSPFVFKGWEAQNDTMVAVFERDEGQVSSLMVTALDYYDRANKGELRDNEWSDAPTQTVQKNGALTALYPPAEIDKATSSYREEKARLLGETADFGARYTSISWVGASNAVKSGPRHTA